MQCCFTQPTKSTGATRRNDRSCRRQPRVPSAGTAAAVALRRRRPSPATARRRHRQANAAPNTSLPLRRGTSQPRRWQPQARRARGAQHQSAAPPHRAPAAARTVAIPTPAWRPQPARRPTAQRAGLTAYSRPANERAGRPQPDRCPAAARPPSRRGAHPAALQLRDGLMHRGKYGLGVLLVEQLLVVLRHPHLKLHHVLQFAQQLGACPWGHVDVRPVELQEAGGGGAGSIIALRE